MTDPRRLRDDPALCEALGLDFAAERASLHAADLGGLKARLTAAIDAGLADSAGLTDGLDLGDPDLDPTTLTDVAAGGLEGGAEALAEGAAAALGAGLKGAGLSAASSATTAGATAGGAVGALAGIKGVVLATAIGVAAGAGGHAVYVESRAPTPTTTTVETAAPPAPEPPPPTLAHAPDPDPAPALEPKPEPAAPRPAPTPDSSSRRPAPSSTTLDAQLRLYERGETALKGGRYPVAIRELAAYLKRYPDGDLAAEAELALLEARVGAGDHRAVEAHARRLLGSGGFRRKAGELHRIRGEALVALGRCADADAALADAVRARPAGLTSNARDALLLRCYSK